jgi:ABC-2 type transport system permease protein
MTGFMTVFKKELEDSFASWRFIILFTLILLASVVAIYIALGTIRSTVTGSTEFIFLALFTTSGTNFAFSFMSILSYLIPLMGIVLGLDAINSERNNGTLSRLLSQPVYRDEVINAKFLAGIVTISIMVLSVLLLVSGLGIYMIGLPPTAEEVWRLLFFLVISIVYGSFWLGISILFSILFRRVATSALAVLAIWIIFAFFYTSIATNLANVISPAGDTLASQVNNVQLSINLIHISPSNLYQESTYMILVPSMRTFSQILQIQAGASQGLLPSYLSLTQSLIQVWPLIVINVLLTLACFAISYIRFLREEIRST